MSARQPTETWRTWANLVTAVRLVAGIVVFSYAAVSQSEAWNFIGLGVYWLLDILDGYVARRFDQETRLGAQFDILSDRVLVAMFYLNYARLYPDLMIPIAMFLFQFMAIDHYLSNQFMRWPIKSPNYFNLVDHRIWIWNWSTSGKLLNSGVVTGVLVVTKSVVIGSIVCGVILVLKAVSVYWMMKLPSPEQQWQQWGQTQIAPLASASTVPTRSAV